jgi:hypothetical protein
MATHFDDTKILTELSKASIELTSPYNDGFTTWIIKQRLYKIQWYLEDIMERSSTYAGEDEWLQEQNVLKAVEKLSS